LADITDALYEADPGWVAAHDEEIRRRKMGSDSQA
jgi:hypothetical protein